MLTSPQPMSKPKFISCLEGMSIFDCTGSTEEATILHNMDLAVKEYARTIPSWSSRLASLDARLRKYASRHAAEQVSTDDLYQIAVEEILATCSPVDNDTYMLRLADWRMKDAVVREMKNYAVRITASNCELEDEDEDIGDLPSFEWMPEDTLIKREMISKIQAVLFGLKPKYMTIIRMLYDGKNHYEIAEAVGTSRQNIEYHIRKIKSIFECADITPSF